jgi:integrase
MRQTTATSVLTGLSGDQVHKLLAVVPESPLGLRDRAIILTLVLTGRRRAEVIGMKAGNLILDGDGATTRIVVRVVNRGIANFPNRH